MRTPPTSPRNAARSQYLARLERKWRTPPTHPLSTKELLRQERLCRFIEEQGSLQGLNVLDIGCGEGFFARFLRNHGARVTALDGSNNALRHFKSLDVEEISLQQDIFPYLNLPDQSFDLILAFDLLAELDGKDYRLAMSELSRLIKPQGKVLIASPLDPNTVDPLLYLQRLMETEFVLEKTTCCYGFYARKLPEWVKLNRTIYLFLEKIAQFLHGDERATYAMVSAKRKKL